MNVFILHWDNGLSYEDSDHGIVAVFATRELAEEAKAICEANKQKMLDGVAIDLDEDGNPMYAFDAYMYGNYTWSVEQVEVLNSTEKMAIAD